MMYLKSTPQETLLFEALRAQQERGSPDLMARAQRALPSCYLPHLYAGAHSPNPSLALRHLQRAQLLAPQSTAVAFHLTRTYLQLGAPEQAVAAGAHSTQSERYAPLLELVAHAHGVLGRRSAQHQALRQAAAANPYYGPTAAALAACALDERARGDTALTKEISQNALAALQHNIQGAHVTLGDWFYLGRLEYAQANHARAQHSFTQALHLAEACEDLGGQQLCYAWLAKVALALHDGPTAQGYLQRRRAMASSAPTLTQ